MNNCTCKDHFEKWDPMIDYWNPADFCDIHSLYQPKRLNPEDAKVCKSLPDSLNWCDPTSVCDSPTPNESLGD